MEIIICQEHNEICDVDNPCLRCKLEDLRAENAELKGKLGFSDQAFDDLRAERDDLAARVGELADMLSVFMVPNEKPFCWACWNPPDNHIDGCKAKKAENIIAALPTPSAASRLRDEIYEECVKIAYDNYSVLGCKAIIDAIRARKEKP